MGRVAVDDVEASLSISTAKGSDDAGRGAEEDGPGRDKSETA